MNTKPELPPLPKPDSGLGVHVNTYSSDLMQAYGEACYRKAIEDAAKLLDEEHRQHKHWDNYAAVYARMIRALIGEKT